MQVYSIGTGPIGTNTYLAYDEETMKGFLVDPGAYGKNVSDKIKEMGIDIVYIILTHGHGDHIMGVPGFKGDFPNAKVVAHSKESDMLQDVRFNMSDQFGQPTTVVPDIFVEDDEHLPCGGLDLQFLFTPGHSPGGMCIYVASDHVLFSGDTLFQSSIGRTDFPGCSYADLKEAVHKKLWPLPEETRVYPGHMGTTTIGFEKENNPFV